MAVIYETKEDFEKTTLQQQAQKLKLDASNQSGSGLALTALGAVAEIYHQRKPEKRGWLSYVGAVLSIAGIIEIVRSWMTRSKAQNLDLERERMGLQDIVLPADLALTQTPHTGCGCKLNLNKRVVEPKSLTEYAEKSAGIARQQ